MEDDHEEMLAFYKDQLKELRDLVVEKENIIIQYKNERINPELEKNVVTLFKSRLTNSREKE